MKKSVIYFAALFAVIMFSVLGCKKDTDDVTMNQGTIYGVVTDKTTGELVQNAGVELLPKGLKTVTGTDGAFEFVGIAEGTYNLYVTKTGYADYKSNNLQVKASDKGNSVAVQLEKLPPALQVFDEDGEDINELNFGYKIEDVVRTLNIFNDGESTLTWQITATVKWITKIKPEEGELKADSTQSVVIMIDRSMLAEGTNETTLHITSNNGSKQLKVYAEGYVAPSVYIYNATNISYRSINLEGSVIAPGIPPFDYFGFVINTSTKPDLNNTIAKIAIPSKEITKIDNRISYKVTDLTAATTYYARAYAINIKDTTYSNEIEFTTLAPTLPRVGIRKPNDITTSSVITGGEIADDGGSDITAKGVCWSLQQTADINGNHTNEGSGIGAFISTLNDLQPNTTYYLRAYAVNAAGVGYSPFYTIKTKDGIPIVSTKGHSSGLDYLIISGSSQSMEGKPITRQGICYNLHGTPTVNDNIELADNNTESFSCRLSNLKSGTTYYCRAFAENEYGIGYGQIIGATTSYEPAIVTGFVYDQDRNPVSRAKIICSNGSSATTDNTGKYSISMNLSSRKSYTFTITADDYQTFEESLTIVPGETNTFDFTIKVQYPFAVDFGNSVFLNTGSAWQMTFACTQSSLMGKTTTRTIRLKNYRSIALNWNLSNLPSKGISVSKSSGTIPAKGEVSVTFTFTYPTTSAQLINVSGCSNGTKAYVWNWESVAGNYAQDDMGNISYNCCACCWQNPYITVGDYSEAFSLVFNQFVILR